jgi:two-component system chemotaxis response regulator CheY
MPRTILVVDDSATLRQQARIFLASQGFQVLEAADGAQGLDRARSEPIDLLLVDVNMPVMNGIDMIAELRKLPRHARTPVFVLTTESSTGAVQRGKAAGATAWLVKPFKPETLLAAIKKVLAI